MRRRFAEGTLAREHRPPARADDRHELDDRGLADLARVSTSTLIHRLLEPQHVAIRANLTDLRALADRLAARDRSPVLRRAANMLDELHEVMSEQFEHEERAVFPCLEAGAAPIHVLGDLHDRHDDVADRLGRLALLTEELPAATADPDVAALRAGFRTLAALAGGHHALERDALLTRFS